MRRRPRRRENDTDPCSSPLPGILRNLAFEQSAFRKEIVAFGGVEALLKVSAESAGSSGRH